MKIFCKLDNKLHEVYKIRCDKVGFPQFLIYITHGWRWLSAKNFTPMESEEIEERYCNEMRKVDVEDIENGHVDADKILCDILLELGYKKLVECYKDVPKWYC